MNYICFFGEGFLPRWGFHPQVTLPEHGHLVEESREQLLHSGFQLGVPFLQEMYPGFVVVNVPDIRFYEQLSLRLPHDAEQFPVPGSHRRRQMVPHVTYDQPGPKGVVRLTELPRVSYRRKFSSKQPEAFDCGMKKGRRQHPFPN